MWVCRPAGAGPLSLLGGPSPSLVLPWLRPIGLGHKTSWPGSGGVPGLGPMPREAWLVFLLTQGAAPHPRALFSLRFGPLLSLESEGEINPMYWSCELEWYLLGAGMLGMCL